MPKISAIALLSILRPSFPSTPVGLTSCLEANPLPRWMARHERRHYAAVSDALRRKDVPQWPTSQNPTPYDILDTKPTEPYSKARFYNLVKLYHPDKHHHVPVNGINHATRLERYRLLILANDILCDPQKRRAYDLYGVGWANGPRSQSQIYRAASRKWREEPGNASSNATWEDWAQWHEDRRTGKKPEPLHMSHMAFAALIFLFVAIGGATQAARAESHTAHVIEKRQKQHATITEHLTRRGIETAGMSNPERLERFLRERENSAFKFAPSRFSSVNEPSANS